MCQFQFSGSYRVSYDQENWLLLKNSLDRGDLPPAIRAQLLDDALFLGLRGRMNYELALNLTRSLMVNDEKEYVVWYTVLRHFEYVENMMVSVNDRTLNKFISMLKVSKYLLAGLI